ncbi:MAG: DMT family transporter [Prevotella sp.]|nr:DMT family transporter [Prevotella sp.]MDY3853269.1 DMT family transporter [Prevotella sp.]
MKTNNPHNLHAHLAIIAANTIFGLGVPITKLLLDEWVTPMGYMLSRCAGAALIFWVISFFLPKEKMDKKDLAVIVSGGLLGIVVSQTLTAWALVYTTPVYFSLIATLTPVATMLLAAAILKEKITSFKTWGVLIGIAGAILMVVVGWNNGTGRNDLLGIALTFLSMLTWAFYLIITRKVSQKYSAVSQMKWIFLTSTLVILPLMSGEWESQKLYTEWAWTGVMEMLFIIVFATVMGYFAIPYAMKYLHATTVSVYTNLQPVVAALVAFILAQDTLTWDKPIAGLLVLLSAYMVNRK